jgi:hypothetical protein
MWMRRSLAAGAAVHCQGLNSWWDTGLAVAQLGEAAVVAAVAPRLTPVRRGSESLNCTQDIGRVFQRIRR